MAYNSEDRRHRNVNYDYRIEFVHLADGRYSTSGALYDIEGMFPNSSRKCLFATREEAIRASAGRVMRHLRYARKQTGWPHRISSEQAEGVLAWIRQTVAREAPRVRAVPPAVEEPVVVDIHAKISIMEDRILRCRKAVAREEKKATPDGGFCERGRAAIAELSKVLDMRKASAGIVDVVQKKAPRKKKPSIGSLLAAAGLALVDRYTGDHYLVEWDGEIPNPSSVNRNPMSYVPASECDDGREQLWLVHESLAEHPQVTLAEAALGKRLEVWTRGSLGRHRATKASWRHAMDLADDDHFQDLIDTAHLTTPADIDSAVTLHLDGWDHRKGRKPALSIKNARRILDEIGAGCEIHSRSRELIYGDGLQVSPGIEYYPRNRIGVAWMVIHGLEDGLLIRERDGFIVLSAALAEARAPMWDSKGRKPAEIPVQPESSP
ncbi:hypothetical protein [Aureimonas glaciei]|uniref:Uncharacterized protein n=1 Tax=Aureimonas glaciei TaxID=1776957 RepID=A0A917DDI1_9HYPH|nr:hypothetical protein [Aureimonas glaciei]GGD28871.1 hypothetical protein GCM10011335_35050 [Aureimonas glaciei]